MDEKEIKIEKVVFGGKGLSRDLGRVTFVPFTLPGERVRVRIERQKSDYLEAQAIDILEPHPERVAPDCRYFGVCGGCQLSHASYESQVAMKLEILKETLQRSDVKHPEVEIIRSKPFGYRYRAQFKYDAHNRKLGFYEMESNRVVDVQECLCLTPALNEVLRNLRSQVCTRSISGLREIECYENDEQKTAVFFHPQIPELASSGVNDLTISFRTFRFPIHPNIFLQVNPGMWRVMIQEVESHHEDSKQLSALELYCGAGFFTAPLANRFATITACEENADAISFAKKNHPVKNVDWICTRVENYKFPREVQAVIVDPPRSGLPQNVLKQLIEIQPAKISYVSCDCTTFGRDLKKLKELYQVEKLTMLDLFPQTYHFESIALLRKR